MNNYYLVRHGQDYDNQEGILNGHRNRPLTEVGINQCLELAKKIKEKSLSIDLVLSSPLNRAFLTANLISAINDFPLPQTEDCLIERDFGVMTGKKNTEIISLCSPDIIQSGTVAYFLHPKKSESFPDLIDRANQLLEKLESQYDNKNILLVSHGDFGKMIYAAYYKLNWQDVLTSFHFGNSEMLLLSFDCDPQHSKVISIEQHNL